MDELQLKRLRWMAQAKPGMDVPINLFPPDAVGGWGTTAAETAQAALDEIERLRGVDVKLRLTESHYKDALTRLAKCRCNPEAT